MNPVEPVRAPVLWVKVRWVGEARRRVLDHWRPCIRAINASTDAICFGIAFQDVSPPDAAGEPSFESHLQLLAWPDPAVQWVCRIGSRFEIVEGTQVVATGVVQDVADGISGRVPRG